MNATRRGKVLEAYAKAPGKVILLGEHFVVRGSPSVAAAINLHAQVKASTMLDNLVKIESSTFTYTYDWSKTNLRSGEGEFARNSAAAPWIPLLEELKKRVKHPPPGLRVRIESAIPPSSGLGSSAAISVSMISATSKALGLTVSRRKVVELAFIPERHIHGNPSGIDQTTSTYGGVIRYMKGEGFRRIRLGCELPLVIGDTGKPRKTSLMVERVSQYLNNHPRRGEELISQMKQFVEDAEEALKRGDLKKMGELMNENQRLLREVGASSESIERMVVEALDHGALGAKLTGAGGGGCVVAVPGPGRANEVASAIREAGGRPYVVKVDNYGLRSWRRS
jgi:mevalonate kinase